MHLHLLAFLTLLSLAQAQWKSCAWPWPKFTPGTHFTVKGKCHVMRGYPQTFGQTKVTVAYNEKWSKLSSKTKDSVKPVLQEALSETIKRYAEFATLPAEIIIILTTDVDGPITAETSNPVATRSPCQVKMMQRWTTEVTTRRPRALQAVAHELYHCVQNKVYGNALDPEYIRDGTANYFSNVVFPESNIEWPGKQYSGYYYDPAVPLYMHGGGSAYAASIFFQSMGNTKNLRSMNGWVMGSDPGNSYAEERSRLSQLRGFVDDFYTFSKEFALQSIMDTSGVVIPTIPEIPPAPVTVSFDKAGTTGTATVKTAPFSISVFKVSLKAGQTARIYSAANKYQRLAYRKPNVKTWTEMPTDATSGRSIDVPCNEKDTPMTFLILFISTADVATDKAKITVKKSRTKQCHGRSGFIHYPLFNPKTGGGYCPEGTHISKTAAWCCPDGTQLDEEVSQQVSLCCPTSDDCFDEIIPDNMRCADANWNLWNKDNREVACCQKGYYPSKLRYCIKSWADRDPRYVQMPQDS